MGNAVPIHLRWPLSFGGNVKADALCATMRHAKMMDGISTSVSRSRPYNTSLARVRYSPVPPSTS
jgi:hypothetical protein